MMLCPKSKPSVSALSLSTQCCCSALYLISFTLSQQFVSAFHFALVFSNLSKHSVSELRLRALSQGFVSGLCLRASSQSIFLALRLSAYYQGSISAFYVSVLLLLYFNFILHILALYLDLCILDRIYLVAYLFGSILLQIKLGNLT